MDFRNECAMDVLLYRYNLLLFVFNKHANSISLRFLFFFECVFVCCCLLVTTINARFFD